MAENTKIQWATHTFNPWRGCAKIAEGCANCYADAQSKRNPGTLGVWGPDGTRVLASESMWRSPVKWDLEAGRQRDNWPYGGGKDKGDYVRPRVFCASLADVFEDWPGIMRGSKGGYLHHADKWQRRDGSLYVEISDIAIGKSRVTLDDARARLFALIDATPNLDWLLLTKRPENVRNMWLDERHYRPTGHRPNVWLGTSIACQEDADRNIPELLTCRDLAAKLFVSAEPLVGPVDLSRVDLRSDLPVASNWEAKDVVRRTFESYGPTHERRSDRTGHGVDWVIVGGESGPHARPCNVDWVRSIVRQCKDAEVACFVKQLGAACLDNDGDSRCEWPGLTQFVRVSEGCKVKLIDHKGGDPSEWPEDLRVRTVPT